MHDPLFPASRLWDKLDFMPRTLPVPVALRQALRGIPLAVTAVRALRRIIDPDQREVHRIRNAHHAVVFQPFPDTFDERYPPLFDAIAAELAHVEAPRVLSFGCSSGAEVRALRSRLPGARILGMDLNRRKLAAARAADPNPLSQYRCAGRIEPDERFDAILALAVFRHGELEAQRPLSSRSIMPFARFEAGLAMLDAALEPGGLIAIWHAHFRLADTQLAARYEAVAVDTTCLGIQDLLYGRDDCRMNGVTETRALFRKRR